MNPSATPHSTPFPIGSWAFSVAHGESVRILDVEIVWNHTVCQVWVPRQNTVGLARTCFAPQASARRDRLACRVKCLRHWARGGRSPLPSVFLFPVGGTRRHRKRLPG